jgi:quercetin dioxygenase-like cupin family protein
MSAVFEMEDACPTSLTIRRAGTGLTPAPESVASGPFMVQMLLSSRTEGEMTAMRAFVDAGIVTHWHSHPRGQILFVLEGVGRVQREGGAVEEVRVGDAIWFAPGERHWHGAAPTSAFGYISVQPVADGTPVHWMEPVNAGEAWS